MERHIILRKGKLQEMDRSLEPKFWQAQPPQASFDATLEWIVQAEKMKG